MKHSRKRLLSLLVLVFLVSCARIPQQTTSEKLPTLTADIAAEKGKASVVRIVGGNWSAIGGGSGFFVEPDKIVTNLHGVARPGFIFAKLSDNETIWTVEGVTAFDIENDLVILKIASEGVPLPLGNSDAVKKGETVYAIGYPGGGEYKLTEGIIRGGQYIDKWLQTTTSLVKGNSGGPMLNSKGEVIGISVARDDFYGYAVPSNTLKALLSQAGQVEPLAQWYRQKHIRAYAYYQKGMDKYVDNDPRAAIIDLNKSIALDSEFVEAYRARGYVKSYYAESIVKYEGNVVKARKQYQAAIKDYNKAIKLAPKDDENYNGRGDALSLYGKFEANQKNRTEARKQYEAAIKDYTKAIKLDSDDSWNYHRRGRAKHLLGRLNARPREFSKARKQYEAAIKDYNKANKLDSENEGNYDGRGWAKHLLGELKTKQGKVAEAQKHYHSSINDSDKAIQLNSDWASAYHTRGVAKEALGAHKGAIDDFDTSIKLKPDYTEAYINRGKAKAAMGEPEAKEIDFTKAMQSLGHGVVSAQELEKAATEMVRIPADEFQMGSKEDFIVAPVHTVYLDEFYIDPYEVTNAQFKAFVDANPEWSKENIPSKYHNGNYLKLWNGNDYPIEKANYPVVYVSWYAAMAYAKWKGKRLPTEAEWEKAARGGAVGKRYVWGDSGDPSKANYGYYGKGTKPVGSYLPNGYGLYNMDGNVWELCLDRYDGNFYWRSPKKNPIVGVPDIEALMENFTTVRTKRVSRGGSWNTFGPAYVSSRGSDMPTNTNGWLGFRCARSTPPQQDAETTP